ncbi:MAG TPA: porin family protein [Longimicrobiales bacterium]|nr:porin family protein [Longimicrobiales bacterium]
MRRALFVLSLGLVAGTSAAAAQDLGARSLELRLGWARSGFGGERVIERGALNGASLGAALALRVTSRLSLQPELQLLQKGATSHGTVMGVAGADTILDHVTDPLRLFYVEAPVLARLELSARPGGVRPYLVAGPYVGWLLGCSSYLSTVAAAAVSPGAPGDSVAVGSACLDDGTRRPEVGAAAGAGVRLPLGRLTGVADVRYEQGLSSVVKGRWGDVRNRALLVTVGLALRLDGGSAAGRR